MMKNIFLLQILFLFIISCSNSQNEKLTVDEIWENYLNSIGNRDSILAVKTYSDSSVTSSKYGTIFSKTIIKYPDKVYQETLYPNNRTVIYILNGDSGIVKSSEGIEQLPFDDVKNSKDRGLIFQEFYYKEQDYQIELIGEEKFESINYYNLKVTTTSGVLNYLINKNNYEIFRLSDNESIMEINETMLVNGIKVVKSSRYIRGEETMEGSRINVKLNEEIDEKIFELK